MVTVRISCPQTQTSGRPPDKSASRKRGMAVRHEARAAGAAGDPAADGAQAGPSFFFGGMMFPRDM